MIRRKECRKKNGRKTVKTAGRMKGLKEGRSVGR